MANINILANLRKRHYEQHPLKHQSHANLADVVTIFNHDKPSIDGVADYYCKSEDLFGLVCALNKREICVAHLAPHDVTWVASWGLPMQRPQSKLTARFI
jgi:hypothetical protein